MEWVAEWGRVRYDVMGGGKTLVRTPLEHPHSRTMAYATLIGHRDIQLAVGEILGLHYLIGTLHGAFVPIMTLESHQNALQNSRPVNM